MILISVLILVVVLFLLEHTRTKRGSSPVETCARCGQTLTTDDLLCSHCHELVQTRCPACGRSKGVAYRFCPWCGSAQDKKGRHA